MPETVAVPIPLTVLGVTVRLLRDGEAELCLEADDVDKALILLAAAMTAAAQARLADRDREAEELLKRFT